MADDVGVLTVTKVEPDAAAAWVRILVKVWDVGNSGGVRESYPDRGGGVVEMRRSGQLLCLF
jgi:hypothetical protein